MSGEFYEAEAFGSEAVDGLDGDGAESVGGGMEFMAGDSALQGEVVLQSFDPVLEGWEGEEFFLCEAINEIHRYI